MAETTLLSPYDESLATRIEATVDHLEAYFDGPRVYAGDLALRYAVEQSDPPHPLVPAFSRLDVSGNLKQGIHKEFKVAHHHREADGGHLTVIDPSTHIPIDIVTRVDARIATAEVPLDGERWLTVPTKESLLAQAVNQARKVLAGETVPARHFTEAELLLAAGPNIIAASKILGTLADNGCALHVKLGYLEALEAAEEKPELVSDSKGWHMRCTDCVESTDYPLTPLFVANSMLAFGTLRSWWNAR